MANADEQMGGDGEDVPAVHAHERLVLEIGRAPHRFGTPAHRSERILGHAGSVSWIVRCSVAIALAISASGPTWNDSAIDRASSSAAWA